MERGCMSSGMVNNIWESKKLSFESHQYAYDLTWPPKSYTCSFCKREFKSAQALGGHMNVHRRDRAKLRQLPPWVLQSSINPDPDLSFSPSTPMVHTFTKHCSMFSPSLSSRSSTSYQEKKSISHRNNPLSSQTEEVTNEKRVRDALGSGKMKGCEKNNEHNHVLKNGEAISLDLDLGFKDPKQALDLELRLGYL